MYLPEAFRIEDSTTILEVLRANSFAILVSNSSSGLTATHLPLLVDSEEPLVLAGHVSKANPHWRSFDGDTDVMAIFSGPHTYVSPSLYVTRPNVPTWNYVTVHAYGRPALVGDSQEKLRHLQAALAFYDPHLRDSQPESVSDEYLESRLGGLVAFKMQVTRLEAKGKLNQNKSEADRLAVRDHLAQSEAAELRQMAEFMTRS
ncbi:MAG TPA: FMN-binding negative transcriptional regulator [Fimbriimonas sp.]|nr:FMN-binding negative transcriptional regulator [Fimbriimonas sp.]